MSPLRFPEQFPQTRRFCRKDLRKHMISDTLQNKYENLYEMLCFMERDSQNSPLHTPIFYAKMYWQLEDFYNCKRNLLKVGPANELQYKKTLLILEQMKDFL